MAYSVIRSGQIRRFPMIRVQSILYNLPLRSVVRTLEYLDNAARNAAKAGDVQHVTVAYGDCSLDHTIDQVKLNEFRRSFPTLGDIEYTHFGANLGSAAGHNRLLKDADGDFVMILNPDVLVAPNLFNEMMNALGRSKVGLVEARQIPIEHPKDYDTETGETGWASTACAIAPAMLFNQLNGFDAETFFLYCDDVDFSWRVRLACYKVVHQCSAVVFHDKRLTPQGGWISRNAER